LLAPKLSEYFLKFAKLAKACIRASGELCTYDLSLRIILRPSRERALATSIENHLERELVTGNDVPRIVAHRCVIEASMGKRIVQTIGVQAIEASIGSIVHTEA
jgi:hypothetical protein